MAMKTDFIFLEVVPSGVLIIEGNVEETSERVHMACRSSYLVQWVNGE